MTQPLGNAFKCAGEGIAFACVSQRNFKIELGFAVVAIALGLAFSIEAFEWAIIATCIGMVLAAEALNTSIEAIVDLASPEYHILAKHAKDCAAGAVLILSLASVAVAVFIFMPRFAALILG